MFDFIVIEVADSTAKEMLQNNPFCEHKKRKHTFLFQGMTLSFDPDKGTWQLSGSVHKYYNNFIVGIGSVNYSDFSFAMWQETCSQLHKTFCLKLSESKVKVLEFGVNLNLPLPFYSKFYVDAALAFKNNPWKDISYTGNLKRAEFQRYYFKIYDKGAQYRHSGYNKLGEILRLEVGVFRLYHLRELSISTLSDLIDIEKVRRLLNLLFNAIEAINFKPYFEEGILLTRPEIKVVQQLSSAEFIQELSSNNKRILQEKNRRLQKVFNKYHTQSLNEQLTELVKVKVSHLLANEQPSKEKKTTKLPIEYINSVGVF